MLSAFRAASFWLRESLITLHKGCALICPNRSWYVKPSRSTISWELSSVVYASAYVRRRSRPYVSVIWYSIAYCRASRLASGRTFFLNRIDGFFFKGKPHINFCATGGYGLRGKAVKMRPPLYRIAFPPGRRRHRHPPFSPLKGQRTAPHVVIHVTHMFPLPLIHRV